MRLCRPSSLAALWRFLGPRRRNEMFSPSNKIQQKVGRARNLSAPLYIDISVPPSLLCCANWNTLANGKIYNAGQVSYCAITPCTIDAKHDTACLATFVRCVRKIAKSDYLAWSSVRTEQLGTHWTDFHENWYLSIFLENLSRKFKFHKNLPKLTGILHENQYTYFYHISINSN